MIRVNVQPRMLRWARERAGFSVDAFGKRFPKLEAWEEGDLEPTVKQLERYAKATHAPLGFLFLPEPPEERLPIPDFRTVASAKAGPPSPDLLDTLYLCQQRQDWFRDFARAVAESPLDFVGSSTLRDGVVETANRMAEVLAFPVEALRKAPTWTEALRRFIGQAEAAGVLVMCSGVVGNNTRRALDPEEFTGGITREQLWTEYSEELDRLRSLSKGSGGNFHLTQAARTSKRFTTALVISTVEGRTLHRDAFRLLGFKKLSTFQELGRSLGVAV